MPRVAAVSGNSATRPMRLSLSPISVVRWLWCRRIGLPICVTLMVLVLFAMVLRSLAGWLVGVDVATARLQHRDLDVAARGHRARAVEVLEPAEGRTHHVVGIGRADRLGDHVLDAEGLEHRAHRAAGDDAGAGRRRAQIDPAGAVAPDHVVVQRAALAQGHAHEVALGGVGGLADRLRHLARLAMAEADATLLVADDHERGEAEAAAAFDHLGDAIDVDELVDELAVPLVPLAGPFAFTWCTCHRLVPVRAAPSLEFQSALARGVRERLDATVKMIAAAVEHHLVDALGDGALGQELADRPGRLDVGARLQAAAHVLFERAGRGHRLAFAIVDDLGVNMLGGAQDGQPRAIAPDGLDRPAHTPLAALRPFVRCGHRQLPLLLLAFLAEDELARVPHALALVRLRLAERADLGGDLPDLLLVGAGDHNLGRLGRGDRDAFRDRIDDVVAVAERNLQVPALDRGAIADAGDLELALKSLGHAGDQVGDERARGAPHRARALGLRTRVDRDRAALHLDRHLLGQRDLQRPLRARHRHHLPLDACGDARWNGDRLLADARHVALAS